MLVSNTKTCWLNDRLENSDAGAVDGHTLHIQMGEHRMYLRRSSTICFPSTVSQYYDLSEHWICETFMATPTV